LKLGKNATETYEMIKYSFEDDSLSGSKPLAGLSVLKMAGYQLKMV